MNRHERRRLAKMQDKPTNFDRQKKCILMLGSDEQGFQVMPKEPPPEEFIALVHAHSDRLRTGSRARYHPATHLAGMPRPGRLAGRRQPSGASRCRLR
jgi:hypothetical protein